MKYFAHSPKDDIPAQPYEAHIEEVRKRALEYAEEAGGYGALDGAMLQSVVEPAAVFHDLGKLKPARQEVLSGSKKEKHLGGNHADAGTAYLLDDRHLSVCAAAAICAHHLGYNDFTKEQNRKGRIFRDAAECEETDKALPGYAAIHNRLIPASFPYAPEQVKGDASVFMRLLLSCLADADHTDTAVNYGKYPAQEPRISLRAAERLAKLNGCVAVLGKKDDECGAEPNSDARRSDEEAERNALRAQMYAACRDAQMEAAISCCGSPVGTGKTTAAMAHLLAQAHARGLRRIFVVLPYTNIIRQSVKKYREMLPLPEENPEEVVAELHHRADFQSKDTRYLTALWRAPIIVTTAVAFFETLASDSPAALRRLHELPGSAVFVDEAHAALPVTLLPLAWRWMNIYAREWGCYWLLASGSLDRFWNIPEIAGAYAADVPEIVGENLRKHLLTYEAGRITYRSDLHPRDAEELVKWLVGYPGPRLVILNTVQSAAAVADKVRELYGRERVEHISTALIPKDRESTLERVKKRLDDPGDQEWTLVATSCVEAGVDFSFRTGFRELGALLSLLQAAGRVNREGLYDDAEMWTFCLTEGGVLQANPGMENSAKVLRRYFDGNLPISPELSTQSIVDEIALYGLGGKHQRLVENEQYQNFRYVEDEFQVIESRNGVAVVDAAAAERILHGRMDWRELQKVSISISKAKLRDYRVGEIADGVYYWDLGYDDFLGYMAGIVMRKSFLGY